jgi:hypothetical protein
VAGTTGAYATSTNTSFNRATFSGGHASFDEATFSRGSTSFPEATFSGPRRVLGSPSVDQLCVRLDSCQ